MTKICPSCYSTKRVRKKRRGWMKYIPLARRYECQRCKAQYLYIELLDMTFKIRKSQQNRGDMH